MQVYCFDNVKYLIKMSKVIIDMTVSLDGYVAGLKMGSIPPGKHGGMSIFDWYFSGEKEYADTLFKQSPGANLDAVKQMFDGIRRLYLRPKTTKLPHGWAAVTRNGAPVFLLTHHSTTWQ